SSTINPTAITPTLSLQNAQGSIAGFFHVVVTNSFGAVTSSPALLTVTNSGGMMLGAPPAITQQPVDLIANQGSTATFSVTVTGAPPISYQWFFGSTALSSVSNSTAAQAMLMITNVGAEHAAVYHVVATNNFGSVTSITVA